MIRPSTWFKSFGDRSLDLQERLFRLLVTIGLCGLAVAIINRIVIDEDMTNSLLLIGAFFAFVGIIAISVRLRKIQLGAAVIGAIIIYLVVPYNFLATGGIYGGAPMYCLFGIIYVCLVVEGKIRYFYLMSSIVVSAGCYYAAYHNPRLVMRRSSEIAYVDSAIALLIVSAWICVMFLFQNRIFRSENAVAKKQKQEIEELNRAQSRFFSGMSHEIRTPINSIIGFNELILRADVSDTVSDDAMKIRSASKMLLSLINDFLDMSKIESGQMDIVPVVYDVRAMLYDISNMVRVRAGDKGLEFHIEADRELPAHLYGDEVRIKQILVNLLNNAVKYTQSGTVTLAVRNGGIQADHVQIIYSVTDTGMGIKEENLPHLFSAFRRVNEEENRYIEGTGLGLSIVKQLVDLMDGDITVNSVYSKGSTFEVTLPQAAAGDSILGDFDLNSAHTLGEREHYMQSFEAPKASVLIVDDDEMNLTVAEGLLRATRMQIDTVTSGADCLRKTLEKHYDVILMDHLMPEMNGIDCMRAIRVQTGGFNQRTPIVVLTANTGGENQMLYRREGFDGYLPKPVDSAQLETELLKHLPREITAMTGVDGPVGVIQSPEPVHKEKRSVMITTESVCDLPKNLADMYQIPIMPFRICTEGGEFMDGIEAETEGILAYIGMKGRNARSDEYDVEAYKQFFTEQLTKAQNIVHLTMGKNLYYGHSNAVEAAKTLDNVTVVNSGHVSSGLGLMVLHAAKCAADGMSAEAIVQEVKELRERVRTSFIVDNTEYLMKADRMVPRMNQICRAFMIHPVLVIKDSSLKAGGVRIGSKDRARKKYITSALKAKGEIDTRFLFITHAGLTKEELEDIREQVKRKAEFQNVIFQKVSPIISINCGPGTFGLIYTTK